MKYLKIELKKKVKTKKKSFRQTPRLKRVYTLDKKSLRRCYQGKVEEIRLWSDVWTAIPLST